MFQFKYLLATLLHRHRPVHCDGDERHDRRPGAATPAREAKAQPPADAACRGCRRHRHAD